jgi:hypothetical protein
MVSLRCIGRCKIFQLGQEKKTKVRFCTPFCLAHVMLPPRAVPLRFSLLAVHSRRRCLRSGCPTVTHRFRRVSPFSKSFGIEVLRHPLLSKYSWAFVLQSSAARQRAALFVVVRRCGSSTIPLHILSNKS